MGMPTDPIYKNQAPEPDLLDIAMRGDGTTLPAPRKNAMVGDPLTTCLDDLCEVGRLCDDCKKARRREWQRVHSRESYARNPEKSAQSFRQWKYGITPEAYAALLTKQGSACAICRRTGRLSIDHDHATGKVRGLLCYRCNNNLRGLDDAEWRAKAEKYLREAE